MLKIRREKRKNCFPVTKKSQTMLKNLKSGAVTRNFARTGLQEQHTIIANQSHLIMNSLFPQYKYSKHLMSLSRTFARDFLAVFCIGHAMFRNILIRLLFDVVSFFICFRLFIPVSRNLHYFPALLIAPSAWGPQRYRKSWSDLVLLFKSKAWNSSFARQFQINDKKG